MTERTMELAIEYRVARLTLCRPERLKTMGSDFWRGLESTLEPLASGRTEYARAKQDRKQETAKS